MSSRSCAAITFLCTVDSSEGILGVVVEVVVVAEILPVGGDATDVGGGCAAAGDEGRLGRAAVVNLAGGRWQEKEEEEEGLGDVEKQAGASK